ncbi:hypothetical protein [Sphingobium bisphenolivorans]|uniref:hypothetical protein n=1 Tax=Sphingobium bisphenolivorans TaxID=1335760 RepID=UPI0003A2AA44|nr:hypothetical protein [Sphingobium bisphenolivorans]
MRDMNAKQISFGLGLFSIALGLAEIAATRRIAGALGNDHKAGRTTLRVFGAREMLAGAGLLAAPAHSALVWNRFAGDLMDLTALGLGARRAPRSRALWGAVAFVAGATLLDAWVARSLDRTTGSTFPSRTRSPNDRSTRPAPSRRRRGGGHATTIEPDDMPYVQAPAITHH